MSKALLTLAVAAVLGFAGCSCRPTPSTSVHIDPALIVLIPSDSVALFGIRVDKLQSTPAYQKYFANRPLPMLDRFVQQTGVDPRKDISEVLVATNGQEPVAMVRGKFGGFIGKQPNLNLQKQQQVPYKGLTLIGQPEAAVVFISSSVAVGGSMSALRSVIDARAQSHSAPPVLLAKAEALPYDSQIWAVSTRGGNLSPIPIPSQGNLSNLNRIIESLVGFSAYADLRNGLSGKLIGNCATDADAKQLGDALRGFLGLARLSTPSDRPEVLQFYDGVQVDQQVKDAIVKMNVSEPALEATVNHFTSFGIHAGVH